MTARSAEAGAVEVSADGPETTSLASDARTRPGDGAAVDGAGNKAAARVLRVLAKFADGTSSYGVSELSRELGMTKNMVHRAVTTLSRHGYLVRDASGSRYQLGFAVIGLGGTAFDQLDLPALCAPFARAMRDVAGETVTLSVPASDVMVTVDGLRGYGQLARQVPLGRQTPLHASPGSRAILAYLPDPDVERYLKRPLERFTESTITDPRALRKEIALVRDRGYAVSYGDHIPGASGVAFPVLDRDGRPHGSLTVVGPAERFTEALVQEHLPELQAIADECNRRSALYSAAASVPELQT